jgi:sulfide:quinone oxidoreductase
MDAKDSLRVVIAGGGVAALEALLALRRLAEERVSIELLAAEPQFWYRPLAVAEPFESASVHGLDLSVVADELGAALILGTLGSVDAEASVVHTTAGAELEFDALLVAIGARPVEGVPGALTFRGPADTAAFGEVLREIEDGELRRVAFALPSSSVWPLPLYELALQSAVVASKSGAEIVLVTSEDMPLGLFGGDVSKQVSELLASRGVEVVTGAYPIKFGGGRLVLAPEGTVEADRVVTMPRLEGPRIPGLPSDLNGFIQTDAHGRVAETFNVFAAGDATNFPVKQGGLAAQQADAAAESIAALAGVALEPKPFEPVLRGLLLTGGEPLFARTALAKPGDDASASPDALWWPPGKIAGRHLAPFLAEHAEAILGSAGG